MVSIKVGVRHTVHDNRFYFSFSELFRRTLFIGGNKGKTMLNYLVRNKGTETYMMYCRFLIFLVICLL